MSVLWPMLPKRKYVVEEDLYVDDPISPPDITDTDITVTGTDGSLGRVKYVQDSTGMIHYVYGDNNTFVYHGVGRGNNDGGGVFPRLLWVDGNDPSDTEWDGDGWTDAGYGVPEVFLEVYGIEAESWGGDIQFTDIKFETNQPGETFTLNIDAWDGGIADTDITSDAATGISNAGLKGLRRFVLYAPWPVVAGAIEIYKIWLKTDGVWYDYTYYDRSAAPGEEGAWVITPIDDLDQAGLGRAKGIDVDSNDAAHVFYDDGADNLYYQTNATGSWVSTNIWSSVSGTIGVCGGDLVVDSNDKPHVYFALDTFELYHGTNAGGSWEFETINDTTATGIFPRPLWEPDKFFSGQFDWYGTYWKVFSNFSVILLAYPWDDLGISWASGLDPSQIRLEFNIYNGGSGYYPNYSRLQIYYMDGDNLKLTGYGGSGPLVGGSYDYDLTLALETGHGGVKAITFTVAFGSSYNITLHKIWFYTDHWYDYTYYDRSANPGDGRPAFQVAADIKTDDTMVAVATYTDNIYVHQGNWDSWGVETIATTDITGTHDIVVSSDDHIYVYYSTMPTTEDSMNMYELTDNGGGVYPRLLWDPIGAVAGYEWFGTYWRNTSGWILGVFVYPYSDRDNSWAADLQPTKIKVEFTAVGDGSYDPNSSYLRVRHEDNNNDDFSGYLSGNEVSLSTGSPIKQVVYVALYGDVTITISKIWLYTDHWYDYTYYDRSAAPDAWVVNEIATAVDRLQNHEATKDYADKTHLMVWNNDDGDPEYWNNVSGWDGAEITWRGLKAFDSKAWYHGGGTAEMMYYHDSDGALPAGIDYTQELV